MVSARFSVQLDLADNAESQKVKKGGSPKILKNRPVARHYRVLQKITQGPQGRVARVSDNHVIKEFDFDELPGPNEIAGNFDIGLRRRGVAARMIMHDDNRRCTRDNRTSEDLTRMNEQRVHSADSDQLMALNPASGVQEQDDHALAIGVEIGIRVDV